jgi:cytoskeletal protein CcmA (bactofilin family)
MWGNKRVETEAPVPTVPASPQAQETNPNKPIAASLERTGISAEAGRPAITTPAGATARLGAGLHVKGEISGREDLHVDGSVEGLIQLDGGKLTVGASAKLTADIVAREIVIYGSVKGNLQARDRIEIKRDASVIGDLMTVRLMIEDGAYLKGAFEIDRKAVEGIGSEETAYARSVSAPAHAAKIAS